MELIEELIYTFLFKLKILFDTTVFPLISIQEVTSSNLCQDTSYPD
jgi:hypothetical protein